MRPVGQQLARASDILATAAAYVAGGVLVVLMILTTADVARRWIFNAPITGVFDLTHFAVLTMTFLGLAYCGQRQGHVAIELLYHVLSRPVQRLLDRLSNLAGAVLFVVIAWRSMVQSIDVRDFGEASQLVQIPYFPFYWLLAFGSMLFALVMALRVIWPPSASGSTT